MMKKYNIEDLYEMDVERFNKIFKTRLNSAGPSSEVFDNLPYEEQLELFEVYLLKYFYFIYDNDIKNVTAQTGETSSGLDCYFSEISADLSGVVTSEKGMDFVLTLEFFEDRDGTINDRTVSEFSLWLNYDTEPGHALSEISFKANASKYKQMLGLGESRDLFGVLKRVYENLAQDEELCAWYILCGIDLKHLLLQDEIKYTEWEKYIVFGEDL